MKKIISFLNSNFVESVKDYTYMFENTDFLTQPLQFPELFLLNIAMYTNILNHFESFTVQPNFLSGSYFLAFYIFMFHNWWQYVTAYSICHKRKILVSTT